MERGRCSVLFPQGRAGLVREKKLGADGPYLAPCGLPIWRRRVDEFTTGSPDLPVLNQSAHFASQRWLAANWTNWLGCSRNAHASLASLPRCPLACLAELPAAGHRTPSRAPLRLSLSGAGRRADCRRGHRESVTQSPVRCPPSCWLLRPTD